MIRLLVFAGALAVLLTSSLSGQEFNALARVLPAASRLIDQGETVELQLALSQGVPYRVYNLDDPRRIIVDFNAVDFSELQLQDFDQSDAVSAVRVGNIAAGWSRMVLVINRPMAVKTAALSVAPDGSAQVLIRLLPGEAAAFAASAGAPDSVLLRSETTAVAAAPGCAGQNGPRPLVVVIDPGHGGIDPGAERDDVIEADLMLIFARELKEILLRAGGFDVVLTRQDNEFVPLEARVSIARRAGADVFISLHADALIEGRASGSTVYTLSERASDTASQKLAERHDRGDLLAGVDLSRQDDAIAGVLMDMARTETAPRSDRLADALVAGMSGTITMHKRPKLSASFSVLKAPDIPSVLLELGFLSSKRDRNRLTDQEWRTRAAIGIRDGLKQWAVSDAADAQLLRK